LKTRRNKLDRIGGITTAVLAVLLTLISAVDKTVEREQSALKGQASDQWSYLLVKGIKRGFSGLAHDFAELFAIQANPQQQAELRERAEKDKKQLARYADEMSRISDEAMGYEHKADALRGRRRCYGLSETFLQIAVGSCAVFTATKVQAFYFIGVGVAVCAVALFVFGFVAA